MRHTILPSPIVTPAHPLSSLGKKLSKNPPSHQKKAALAFRKNLSSQTAQLPPAKDFFRPA